MALLALSLTLPHALVMPVAPTVPQSPAMAHQQQLVVETQPVAPSSLPRDAGIFPGDHHLPAMLVADDKELTTEEEEKRDGARKLAAIIFFLGAAPSFYAQYELVWKKQWEKE